jgi:thymidylate kinase
MTPSVAIEGLPGSGKTTLVDAVRGPHPEVILLGELVLPAIENPSREFFVSNDRAKAAQCRAHDRVVMDRFWASTVAYVLAESWMGNDPLTLPQVVESLYGRPLAPPTAWVFLDSKVALQTVNAADGLFPDPKFRRLLRNAYFEILAWLKIPVLVVRKNGTDVAAFIARHLSET